MTNENYPDGTNITHILECSLSVSQMLSVIIMYISICAKRKNIADTVNKLIQFDSSMFKINCNYKVNSSLAIILVLCTYAIIVIGLFVTSIIGYPESLTYLVLINGDVIINLFIIEYAIILELIISRIRSLNKLLLKIGGRTLEYQEDIFFKTRVKLKNTNLIELTSIRQAIATIYTISSFTVNLFSFPLLWIILYDSGVMIYSAYYIIMPFIYISSDGSLISITTSMLSFMISVFSIIMLAQKVENFKEEMNRTGDLIHKIMSRSILDNELRDELQNFSLELLHRKVNFTATGMFSINSTLIKSILGTAVTYLIILLQVETKDKK
ncbi:hypothetical protein HCN44_005738 [Aphidius gifuensis]|uniref:Gustatory receptor n=1 Tax=Aphidius gifuensis TaxID=684658 RepID=A0A835CR64_APHGI|nr:hypothetical protein HCN44_005738 [Aphidius gifuensis]